MSWVKCLAQLKNTDDDKEKCRSISPTFKDKMQSHFDFIAARQNDI